MFAVKRNHATDLSLSRHCWFAIRSPVGTSISAPIDLDRPILFCRAHMDGIVHSGYLHLAHVPNGVSADLAHASHFALPARLFLVCGEVEGNEEDEIGRENADAGECGEFLAGACAFGWELRKVGTGEISVRSKIDESYATEWLVSDTCGRKLKE